MIELLLALISGSGPVVGMALVGCLVFLWREMRAIRTELLSLLAAQNHRVDRLEERVFPAVSANAKA